MRLAQRYRMKNKIRVPRKPVRSSQVPVTVEMLHESEARLMHKIESLRSELKAEINGVKSEMHGLKAEIHGLKSEMHGLKSEMHGNKSELHRIALLVEEQNARNKYVMDGYAQLYELIVRKLGN